jgi:nucleoside-diphosphate-sugar epimerase
MINNALLLKNLKIFVHLSSVDVYTQEKETKLCDETHTFSAKRRHGYSITKARADEIVLKAYKDHKLPITILRYIFKKSKIRPAVGLF